MENGKSLIEIGKFADLIVVNIDPLTIDTNKIKGINVDMTFLSG